MTTQDVPDWAVQVAPSTPTVTQIYTDVPIVASSSGATTIVASVASKAIVVVKMRLIASDAVNVKWQSHTTPTDLDGLAYLAANGGYVLPFDQNGWFRTIAGQALDINLSAAVAVGGVLSYALIG